MTDMVGALQGLVDALVAAGVEASTDPADLNLPGVFVTLDRLTDYTIGGPAGTIRARLILVVPDQDHRRSLAGLQDLYNDTTAVVDPTSDVEATTAAMPSGPELPALTFTTDL